MPSQPRHPPLTSSPESVPESLVIEVPGPAALCADGTYSDSPNRQGTCSGHGGVRVWNPAPPSWRPRSVGCAADRVPEQYQVPCVGALVAWQESR
jgi:hypothetical protein